jgi:CRISPR-associated protein Cas5h
MSPVRTVAHEMSMLGKGWAGSGSDFNRPTSIELVVQPHYRVYYQGPLQDELTDRIRTARSHYHTYLGSAYCLTFPAFVSAYSDAELQSLSLSEGDSLTCVSVVPSKAISRLLPREKDEYARVGGMLYEHIGGRRFRGTLSLIYEVGGRPVSFVPSSEVEADGWKFLRIPEEGIVCLW